MAAPFPLITQTRPAERFDNRYVTHGHSDHAGGAKHLQETDGARVLASAADWDLLAQAGLGRNAAPPVAPAKDMVIADRRQLTLGDTTITMHLTPATSLGTVSLIMPVQHNGKRHVAAFWGGNVIGSTSPRLRLTMFGESARRFEAIATSAGADVLLTNHERYFDLNKRLFALQANPKDSHPFVEGQTRVRNYMQVLNSCSAALAMMAAK